LKLFLFAVRCPSPNAVWFIATFVVRPLVEITTARRNKSSYSFWIIIRRKKNLESFCFFIKSLLKNSHSESYVLMWVQNYKSHLQPTWKRDDTEEPGESGGNSGGPDVADIYFYFNNSSKRIGTNL
jgi:hypothetical protein